MKVSVITTCFNSAATIEATLRSVQTQDYPDLEYLIVDGGSTDETMEIVGRFDGIVTKRISEPDRGIYDALNKGLAMATGDVVGFLHSDDFFAHGKVISSIAHAFQTNHCDAVYGDLDYVDRTDTHKIIRSWRSTDFDANLFYRGWMPAHPTFYMLREHYLKWGGYDTGFRQSADYELMLRMLLKHKLNAVYIPSVLVKMRDGGASNVSWSNRWKANQEDARAWKKNGLKPWFLTRFLKPLSKLQQFFK